MSEEEASFSVPVLEAPHQYHAFISHSSEDVAFAYELTEKLEGKDFKCFMYERDLPPDGTVIAGVAKNMKKSRRVILILTEAFLESRWAVFEALEALHLGYSAGQMVLVPILYNISVDKIPHYLRPYRCLEFSDEHFWRLLMKALVEDRPTTALIPAGNVAHGLAWSYYYGYLKLVLPGITDRSEKWITQKEETPKMLMKMMIIIPSTCYCPESFGKIDPQAFSHEGFIDFKATRAGNIERNYKSSVYRVKDPDNGEQFLFIGEFATPLMSMYEMVTDGLAGLDEGEKLHQRMLFTDKLKEILSHPSNRACHNKFTMLEYDDETKEKVKLLPSVICQHIRHELKKEQDLQAQMKALSLAPETP